MLEGDDAARILPRRGRPPKTTSEITEAANAAFAEAAAAFNAPAVPMATVIISVKPSEAWRCPWVDGKITAPKQQLRVPLSLARDMEKNEQAMILEND